MTRRILAVVCVIALMVSMLAGAAASAEKAVANSLYTRIDPATGKTYNLKGKTVYLYDYWTFSDWHKTKPASEEEEKTWEYRKWLEKTYNCKIVQIHKGDWGSQVDELKKFVRKPGSNLALFIVPSTGASTIAQQELGADWKKSTSISLSDRKWNQNTIQLMTFGSGVYGVATGKSEPQQCLYFNKRVLEEAGIDWNKLYDLQKSGKWNWDAFEAMLKNVQRDTDGDGETDIWGLTGSSDDLYRVAVFSNGGSYFDLDSSGKLASTVGSAKSKRALTWGRKIWRTYAAKQPEGSSWDWYKDFWKEGKTGFYMYQVYGGFNVGSEMSDMEDPWGAVAFPKGPNGKSYVTLTNGNITVIPSCYNKKQISMVSMIYDLWTSPAPDMEELDPLSGLSDVDTDERAIKETYALLMDHGVTDKTELLGSINDILGMQLLWSLTEGDLDELIRSAKESWAAYIQTFNEIVGRLRKEQKERTAEINKIQYELDPADKTAKVTGASKKTVTVVKIPNTIKAGGKTYKVTAIADQAFSGYKKITKVTLGKYVTFIGKEAFKGCAKLKSVAGGEGLTVIGDGVFSGCSALTAITLNKKVSSIGDEAFFKCKNLKKISLLTTKLTDDLIGKNAFKNVAKKAVVECPAKKVKAYTELLVSKGLPKTAKIKSK